MKTGHCFFFFYNFFQKTVFPKFKQLNSGCSLSAGVYGRERNIRSLVTRHWIGREDGKLDTGSKCSRR